jgi:putative redox protein
MRRENLEIDGSAGCRLAATLDRPEGEPTAYALFAHCFTCSKDFLAPVRVGQALAEHGVAMLRFDFTGLGQSCGELEDTGFSTNVDDVIAAAAFLRERHGAPALLLGHSLGGAAVLAAASRIPEVRAVVTIAAPSRPAGLRRLVDPVADRLRRDGTAEILVAGRPFTIGRRFLDDMERFTLEEIMRDLRAALLVLHSPADETVPPEAAREIFDRARHPKSFVSLDDADHLLSRRADAEWVAGVVLAWSARYLRGGAA